jgi:hypothetical protein
VPEAPCGVASFASLTISASPSTFVYDALTSPEEHLAAARGTKHLRRGYCRVSPSGRSRLSEDAPWVAFTPAGDGLIERGVVP